MIYKLGSRGDGICIRSSSRGVHVHDRSQQTTARAPVPDSDGFKLENLHLERQTDSGEVRKEYILSFISSTPNYYYYVYYVYPI